MSYVTRSLGDDEEVILRGHFHWINYVVEYTWLIGSIILAAVLWFWVEVNWLWLLPIPLIGLFFFLKEAVKLWSTEMAVTNHRLIFKTGLFHRRTEELGLHNVEEINVEQGLLGRILDYGHVKAMGTGAGEVVFPDIGDPIAFRRAIDSARRNAREGKREAVSRSA